MSDGDNSYSLEKAPSGLKGLDTILNGGFPRHELYLIQGEPGTGKTTLGLQFLLEGVQAGEKVLYITLSQTEVGLQEMARSHGWSLENVPVHELNPAEAADRLAGEQTVFHTADVELGEMTDAIFEAVKRVEPDRLVFDSISEMHFLADSSLRYRRQLLNLKRFLGERHCTTLLLDHEPSEDDDDRALRGLAHGLIVLEQVPPEYGDARRRLQVVKMRGMPFLGGYHNYEIRRDGLEVYARLLPDGTAEHADWDVMKSGIEELDQLLGGGLEEGTACLVMGPTGTGKSSVATLYAFEAAKQGKRSAIFLFDERPETFYRRSEGLGMDIRPSVNEGLVSLRQIDTGELSAGEFAQLVREAIEVGAKIIIIDSLTGYVNAMPQEKLLITQMHELLNYLSHRGVLSLLVVAQHGVVGSGVEGPIEVSYMADSVLLLRHFEAEGSLRKAVSVVKKRQGNHEKTIRELRLVPGEIKVGGPIEAFSGVLTGTPNFEGRREALMDTGDGPTEDGND